MKSKKKYFISAAIISTFLFSTVAFAYIVENFSFNRLGQREETDEHLYTGNKLMVADYNSPYINATLGLSISKKNFLGQYVLKTRCNPATYGKTQVSCESNERSDGDYRGTLVFNTSEDGKPIDGTFYIRVS